jgi:hypothetical protein
MWSRLDFESRHAYSSASSLLLIFKGRWSNGVSKRHTDCLVLSQLLSLEANIITPLSIIIKRR